MAQQKGTREVPCVPSIFVDKAFEMEYPVFSEISPMNGIKGGNYAHI